MEISRYLSKYPERASNIRRILAADEGVRYPIAVTALNFDGPVTRESQGSKTHFRVRKGCLYQFENEKRSRLEFLKSKHPEVSRAVAELGQLASKNSMSLDKFKTGYLEPWIKNFSLLIKFYSRMDIRALRMHCAMFRMSCMIGWWINYSG